MIKLTAARILMFFVVGFIAVSLTACSYFGWKSAADTPAAASDTAYYMCSGCHGPDNTRVNYMSPNIIGQKKGYLVTALRDYRDKKRIDPLMNGAVANMTDKDIDNLATYYAQAKKETDRSEQFDKEYVSKHWKEDVHNHY